MKLGFLKTGAKGSAQGNFGLMDLVAGLHWLRENLPAFNGDPSKLILMGHGTGASLANMLLISPVASDLIRRAILLSGSSLSPWAIQSNPLYVKRKVAEHTGCHGDLVEDDLAPCLRTKSLTDLLSTSLEMPRFVCFVLFCLELILFAFAENPFHFYSFAFFFSPVILSFRFVLFHVDFVSKRTKGRTNGRMEYHSFGIHAST